MELLAGVFARFFSEVVLSLIQPPILHRTYTHLLLEKPCKMLRIFKLKTVGDFVYGLFVLLIRLLSFLSD